MPPPSAPSPLFASSPPPESPPLSESPPSESPWPGAWLAPSSLPRSSWVASISSSSRLLVFSSAGSRGSASGLSSPGCRSSGSWSSEMPPRVAPSGDAVSPEWSESAGLVPLPALGVSVDSVLSVWDSLLSVMSQSYWPGPGRTSPRGVWPSDEGELLLAAGEVLVSQPHGALQPFALPGPLAGGERLRLRHAARGEVADRLGDDAQLDALVLHERLVDDLAVARHHDRRVGHQADHEVERRRPLERPGVVADERRVGLLHQVAAQQHVGVRHAYDEVAGRVPAPG